MKRISLDDKPVRKKKPKPNAYYEQEAQVGFYSSGCTGLDCCLSRDGKGWVEKIVNIVGDRSSGKSLLACEAAANYLKKYPDAHVWYRDVEAAFDWDYIESLGIPISQFDRAGDAFCVEDVFDELTGLIKKKERGLYVVDSLDALTDRAEVERDIDKATYGTQKAAKMSQMFRRLNRGLSKCEISVIFISQVRDKIGVTFGERHKIGRASCRERV